MWEQMKTTKVTHNVLLLALPTQGKDIVFRFIIEYIVA
jgi:hypothetical protein